MTWVSKEKVMVEHITASGITYHSPNGFGQPKYVCGQVQFPEFVSLVAQLGEELLEK